MHDGNFDSTSFRLGVVATLCTMAFLCSRAHSLEPEVSSGSRGAERSTPASLARAIVDSLAEGALVSGTRLRQSRTSLAESEEFFKSSRQNTLHFRGRTKERAHVAFSPLAPEPLCPASLRALTTPFFSYRGVPTSACGSRLISSAVARILSSSSREKTRSRRSTGWQPCAG